MTEKDFEEQEELDFVAKADPMGEPEFIDMTIMDNLSGIVVMLGSTVHELNYEDAKFLARALTEELEVSNPPVRSKESK